MLNFIYARGQVLPLGVISIPCFASNLALKASLRANNKVLCVFFWSFWSKPFSLWTDFHLLLVRKLPRELLIHSSRQFDYFISRKPHYYQSEFYRFTHLRIQEHCYMQLLQNCSKILNRNFKFSMEFSTLCVLMSRALGGAMCLWSFTWEISIFSPLRGRFWNTSN